MLEQLRDRGWRLINRGGALGDAARKVNDVLGRPLASKDELEDRKAFAAGYAASPIDAVAAPAPAREVAPVIVYHMDKQRRDLPKVVNILDARGIPYQVMNVENDAAQQAAIRREAKGHRYPIVYIAGDPVGGREALINLDTSGELRKKVFGA